MVGAPSFYTPPALAAEAGCQRYLRYLVRRDGPVDPEAGTLAHREHHLEALDRLPVRLAEPVDRGRYEAALTGRGRTPSEAPLLLAVALARAAGASPTPPDPRSSGVPLTALSCLADAAAYVRVEARCRSRLLGGAVRYFGLAPPPLPVPGRPGLPSAALHRLAPGAGALAAFAGAVAVTYRLHTLLASATRVLAREPAVRDAVEERLVAALTDAVGHVAFHRLRLGRAGHLAKRPAGALACGGVRAAAEVRALGAFTGGPENPAAFDLRLLPGEVRRQAFFV